MRDREGQAPGPHLLLYDGECGFCHRVVRFVLARDRRGIFRFAALQSAVAARELDRFGGRPADLTTFYVIEDYRSDRAVLRSRARAMWVVTSTLGWPWKAASLLRLLPDAWTDAAYGLVARHRRGILGPADRCFVPRPEQRGRFLDEVEAP
jgi:predicted DCC family thiol-disulfide oxidoreductase YuxK